LFTELPVLRPDKEVDLNVSFGEVGSIERERMINGLGVSEDVLMFTLMERSFFWSLKELTDRKDVRHLLSFARLYWDDWWRTISNFHIF
jgi:hypothetical protein